MATPRAIFWRFAYRRYRGRAPLKSFEIAAFAWAGFFLLVYGGSLVADFGKARGFIVPGLVAVGLPATLGLLHRRIRIERSKGADALYRKSIAPDG